MLSNDSIYRNVTSSLSLNFSGEYMFYYIFFVLSVTVDCPHHSRVSDSLHSFHGNDMPCSCHILSRNILLLQSTLAILKLTSQSHSTRVLMHSCFHRYFCYFCCIITSQCCSFAVRSSAVCCLVGRQNKLNEYRTLHVHVVY